MPLGLIFEHADLVYLHIEKPVKCILKHYRWKIFKLIRCCTQYVSSNNYILICGRPKAQGVLHHPLFWSSEMRLSFLREASDRVELEDRQSESKVLNELESIAAVALDGKWDEKLEPAFLNNIGHYRRYKFDSVRDLLRVIRNKQNHYREIPQDIQELLGPLPEGFDGYFSSRFPKLLIEVYKVLYKHCKEEKFFLKYMNSSII